MEARVLSLDDVLRERQRWCVPVYQRHYEWETGENGQLHRLWEDLEEKAEEFIARSAAYPHYIGAIIVAEPPNQPFGTVRQRLLVDGQQRITTFQLVLTAIREVARRHNIDTLIPVIEAYLFNEISGGMSQPQMERYKLWPSSYDRALYQKIATEQADALPQLYPDLFYKNGNLKFGAAPNLLAAFWYLLEKVEVFVLETEPEGITLETRLQALLKGFLAGFRVVVIQLDDKDDAQEIFASLNGLGKPLKPIDLVRNDVFHRARRAGEDDEAIFADHWKEFEDPFWQIETRQGRFKKARIDFFLGHMLVVETAKEVNLGKLAAEYQGYARKRSFESVASEIRHILRYVPAYRSLLRNKPFPVVDNIARFLSTWDLTVFFPLVFHISVAEIDDTEKVEMTRIVTAYIVRREICGLTSKNYNNLVVRALGRLEAVGSTTAQALRDFLMGLEGDAVRLPSDTEVIEKFARRNAYRDIPTPRLRFVLEGIEHHKRTTFDESVMATGLLTIEHVMPQRWAEKWKLPDGSNAPCESSYMALVSHKVEATVREMIATRERWVDTVGNLTLVTGSLNPSLGNENFDEKKARLAKSLLVLNREIGAESGWTENTIRDRGIALATVAAKVWSVMPPDARDSVGKR